MQDKQYQAYNQGGVNESGGNMKCEKSEQPKNDQNGGDYPKHFFHLLASKRESICDLLLSNCADASWCAGKRCTDTILVTEMAASCPVVNTSAF
jgi:hypothetical protein